MSEYDFDMITSTCVYLAYYNILNMTVSDACMYNNNLYFF